MSKESEKQRDVIIKKQKEIVFKETLSMLNDVHIYSCERLREAKIAGMLCNTQTGETIKAAGFSPLPSRGIETLPEQYRHDANILLDVYETLVSDPRVLPLEDTKKEKKDHQTGGGQMKNGK